MMPAVDYTDTTRAVRGRLARWAVAFVLSVLSQTLRAGSLGSESSIGLQAEYNSNPFLLTQHAISAESAAVQLDLPLTYTIDAQSFEIVPRLRQAASRSSEQLLTNYEYLDADWKLATERSSLSLGGGWHRDSTLYNIVENATLAGRTLPRLDESASLAWQYALTERGGLQLMGTYERVAFGRRPGFQLPDNRYMQGTAELHEAISDRTVFSVSGGVGRYALIDLPTRNITRFVQSSVNVKFDERWSGSAQGGYSRVGAESESVLCCRVIVVDGHLALAYIRVHQSSSEGILSYALSIQRQSEIASLALSVSRSVQPSSFGALLTQNEFTFDASRKLSERWSARAMLRRTQQSNSFRGAGDIGGASLYVGGISLQWQCTEHWDVALDARYNTEHGTGRVSSAAATSVSLTLSRRLGRIAFD